MRDYHALIVRQALILCLTGLTSCSLTPELEHPVAPVPTGWPEGFSAAGAREIDGLDWREFLPDPRLQALVTQALQNNRDLRVAVARVDEARAIYGITRADRLPSVNLAATANQSRTPAALSPTGEPLISRRYDVGLSVTGFELDFWGRVKSLDQAALASYLATDQAQAAFRLSLVADVADAYFALQEMEQRAMLADATVNSRAKSRQLVMKRQEVGLAGDLDVLAADAAYAASRASLANLERSRAAAQNALVLLVGNMPDDLPEPRPLTERDIAANLAVDVPSTVLLRRPDVRAAEQKLIAANANIGAARAAFLPRIRIGLAAGIASPTVAGLFDGAGGAWNFAPSLVQPLFDSGRNRASLDLAQARQVIAVAEYEGVIQRAFREVADLLAARDTLARQLTSQEQAQQAQEDRLKLVNARYNAGVSNYLEVLDAQRESYSAQQATLQVRSALLSSAAQLYKALGGGQVANQ